MSELYFPRRRWNWSEPRLEDLLDDPVCRLLMQSDGVTVQGVSGIIDRVRSALRNRGGAQFVNVPCRSAG